MKTKVREKKLSVLGLGKGKKRESIQPGIQINEPSVDWLSIWESDAVRKRANADLFNQQIKQDSKVETVNFDSSNNQLPSWEQTTAGDSYWSGVSKNRNENLWNWQSDNSISTTQQKGLSTKPNYSAFDNKQSDTKEKDQISSVIKEDKPQSQNIDPAPKQNQKQESTEKAVKALNIYPSLKGGTYEGYPELNISKNFYTNGLDHYYKAFDRILPADNSGKLIASWGTEESYTPKITELGENLKAGKPMPRLSAIDLGNATDKEREFHTTLTEIYKANSEAIENDKKRKAQAKEQAISKSTATQNSLTPWQRYPSHRQGVR